MALSGATRAMHRAEHDLAPQDSDERAVAHDGQQRKAREHEPAERGLGREARVEKMLALEPHGHLADGRLVALVFGDGAQVIDRDDPSEASAELDEPRA